MNQELKSAVLDLYPEYDRVYGPYNSGKDGRSRVVLNNSRTKAITTRQLAKLKLEVRYGRRLMGDETADHKNGIVADDRDNNLRVLPRAVNSSLGSKGNKHALGTKQSDEHARRGDKNGMAKLTNEQVEYYRTKYSTGEMTREDIINETGIMDRSVRNFLSGKSYTRAGGPISKLPKAGRPRKQNSEVLNNTSDS